MLTGYLFLEASYLCIIRMEVRMFDAMNEFLPLGQSILHPLLTQVEHGTVGTIIPMSRTTLK
jgi:hypothetical protein